MADKKIADSIVEKTIGVSLRLLDEKKDRLLKKGEKFKVKVREMVDLIKEKRATGITSIYISGELSPFGVFREEIDNEICSSYELEESLTKLLFVEFSQLPRFEWHDDEYDPSFSISFCETAEELTELLALLQSK